MVGRLRSPQTRDLIKGKLRQWCFRSTSALFDETSCNISQRSGPENTNTIMAQPEQSRLLRLADELLIQIAQHIDSSQDLCSLAVTCSRLQGFAEPVLYSSILIRNGSKALKLFNAILRRSGRALFVRKLHIRYRSDGEAGIEILNLALLHLLKLKELLIEAPCCNDTPSQRADFQSQGKIDYATYFEFASSMTLGPQPQVQIPLETRKFTHLVKNSLSGNQSSSCF